MRRRRKQEEGTPAAKRYRMRDLCALAGLERQTIHFYIQEGLLPEGTKTGRNMAFYDEEHLERLQLIKTLQSERFLPLRAIRAILGGGGGGFSKEQRALLSEVKRRIQGGGRGRELVARDGRERVLGQKALASRAGVGVEEVRELVVLGLVAADERGHVRESDAWLVEAWGELMRAGLTRDRGFSAKDLALVDEGVAALFARARDLFLERLGHLSAEELAQVVVRVLPLMSDLIARMFTQKARDTFALAADEPERAVPVTHPTHKRSAA